jgi:hypothetical protein
MGLEYAEIELIKTDDLGLARRNYLDETDVRRIKANMLVDTGSIYHCINENIQEQIQLPFCRKKKGSTCK